MIKYPSVQGTVGKKASTRIKPKQEKQKVKTTVFVKLFGQKFRQRPELNAFELFIFVTCMQTPLEQCAAVYELTLRWGARNEFFCSALLTAILIYFHSLQFYSSWDTLSSYSFAPCLCT